MIKKNVILLSAVLLILSLLFACGSDTLPPDEPPAAAPPDFRAAEWGMSKAQVKKTEMPAEETYADEWTMLFEVTEGEDSVLVFYYFEDDKLTGGECWVEMGEDQLWSVRVPQMIETYVEFRDKTTEVYGEPQEDDYKVWLDKDPDFINDHDMQNLYYGRLEYLTVWETERSDMSLRLYYKNLDFKFVFEAYEKSDY